VAASCAYLLLLTCLSYAPAIPASSPRELRFDVVVPAHDEAAGIAGVLVSLRDLDWPADRYRVVVVADNCSDATATIARAAGACVLERHDLERRGKGYALEAAFASSAALGWADAVVVIDADSAATPALLEAFACRIARGAGAIQAHYGVLNPAASWRTRLMSIALGSFHRVRSRAREHLRVSCGLRGNGWCITHALLKEVPYRAFSLTEDVEYGIDLGLAGHRVEYADEAEVAGVMVSGARAAATQRQRWEKGRVRLIRSRLGPLLRGSTAADSRVCLDLAVDLLVAPLSVIMLAVIAWVGAAAAATLWEPQSVAWLWAGLACAASLSLYVLRGWQLSRVGLRGFIDLAYAPWFAASKVLLMLRRHDSTQWIRTERERK